MSSAQLSDQRSRRRWPIIVSVLTLLPLFIALFGRWQLKQLGITIKSLFPLEVTKQNELRFNTVSNDKYGRSFWYFYTPEGGFLFAIGCENQSDHFSLHPGLQALLSDNLLLPSFSLRYRGRFLRVHYDATSDSLDIQGETFDLQRGNLLLLRGESGTFEIEQHTVTVNQEVFPEQNGSLRLREEIDKVVPQGKRE